MKLFFYTLILFLSCFFISACQTDTASNKKAPVVAAPIPGSVATPSNISRPDEMTNNFERMQGEWRQADDPQSELQVRGNVFLEIKNETDRSEVANQFKVLKECGGAIDLDGNFFMVGNTCYQLLKISVEEMEVENLDQQKVIKYNRI